MKHPCPKLPYNALFNPDRQISMEERIAGIIFDYSFGDDSPNEEESAELGRDLLYIMLREFRPDLFGTPIPEGLN